MLIANPSIKGIWAVWDVPAEGVISAARTAGRDDLVITTIDLGENVAIDMAQDGSSRASARSACTTRASPRRCWPATGCSARRRRPTWRRRRCR